MKEFKPALDYRDPDHDRIALREEFWELLAQLALPLAFWGFLAVVAAVLVAALAVCVVWTFRVV